MTPKTSLRTLQKQLFSAIHSGQWSKDLSSEISNSGGPDLSPERRLWIYHTDYKVRLLDLLGAVYTPIKESLGPLNFRQLCEDFIQNNPPTSSILGEACLPFPEFIQHRLPDHYETAAICMNEFLAEESPYENDLENQLVSESNSASPSSPYQDPTSQLFLRLNKTAKLFAGKRLTFVSLADSTGVETLSFNKNYFHLIIPFQVAREISEIQRLKAFKDLAPEMVSSFFKEMIENRVLILHSRACY